jgi:hypothetical protein
MRRVILTSQPRGNKFVRSISMKKFGVVVHICHPSDGKKH